MNTNQDITIAAGATGTGITFSTQLYSKVSVIIKGAAVTDEAVLLWSGNNIDFTTSVAASAFSDRTDADGGSLGFWWMSGDTGVLSSYMKVEIYTGGVIDSDYNITVKLK
jgi:hypothetical protein|tara:strand:- start:1814 stop:2143 length:330 start_codon:yes stop_codon:yes gene_type:complete